VATAITIWIRLAYPDPDYRAQVLANWERDVLEPSRDVAYRVRCHDGSDKVLMLGAGLLPNNLMIVTLSDITAREEAKEALRESEERFRTMAATLPTAMVVHTAGRIQWANRAATQIAEVSDPEDLVGRDVFSVVHPDSLAVTKQRIASLYAKTGDAAWIESRFQRADGTPIEVEVASGRIDWRGQPAALVLFNDISSRRKAEEERRALEARVQEAQRLKRTAAPRSIIDFGGSCRRGGRPNCASRRSALAAAVPGGVLPLLDTLLESSPPGWQAACTRGSPPGRPHGPFMLPIPLRTS
jgi:PAS domain S-box-containing protein